jgi:hypothetical protein
MRAQRAVNPRPGSCKFRLLTCKFDDFRTWVCPCPILESMEKRRRYKIQPQAIWDKVQQDYLSGLGARQTAEKYGVGEEALRARARREGWSRYLQAPTEPVDAPAGPPPLFDAAPEPDGGDPAALARTALRASGRAMRGGAWSEARALSALAETYRKLAERAAPPGGGLTAETAPLSLVLDIVAMDRGSLNTRFAVDPDNVDADPVKTAYWRMRNAEFRRDNDMWEVVLRRRFAQERWIEALEAQLKAHGLDLPDDAEADRRVRDGRDVISTRGRMTHEDWEAIETW